MDKRIADVRAYPPDRYAGIVLFRPSISGRGAVRAFIRRHLPIILHTDLAGHLISWSSLSAASESGESHCEQEAESRDEARRIASARVAAVGMYHIL